MGVNDKMLKLSALASEVERYFPEVPPPAGRPDDWKQINTLYFFCHYDSITVDVGIGAKSAISIAVREDMTLVDFTLQLERLLKGY